jgi:hypothetical protein
MYKEKAKKLVLSEGETIGHKHVLEAKPGLEFDRANERIRMKVNGLGVLTHDEHDRMVFSTGKYRSYHQVEFNPMDSSVNRVFD